MNHLVRLRHLKEGFERVKTYATNLVSKSINAVSQRLDQLATAKADKAVTAAVTILSNSWQTDDASEWPYFYDIAIAGVTDKHRGDVIIAPESMRAAVDCGLCPTSESRAGEIRIRAKTIPQSNITAVCWAEEGKG